MLTQIHSFINNMNRHKYFIVFIYALILSITLTLITYPGIFYSDSYVRLDYAKYLLQGGTYDIWLTPTPSLLMAICYFFVNNWAFYTFLQSFFFMFSIFLVAIKLTQNNWPIAVLLLTTPTFLAYSVYHEMSVVTVTAMLYSYLLILYIEKTSFNFSFFIVLPILALMTFLFISYRQNAFTVLPVYIVFCLIPLWKERKKSKKKELLTCSAMILGALSVSLVVSILSIQQINTSAAGFTWELVHMIRILPAEKQEHYEDYLDDIIGEGNTMNAVEVANYNNVNSIYEFAAWNVIGLKENSDEIFKRYVEFFVNEPRTFFSVKMKFIELTLKPLPLNEYNYNRWDDMESYNFNDTPQRLSFVDGFNAFSEKVSIFRAPWVVYLLALLSLIYQWKSKQQFMQYVFLFFLAVFYYGAFLINNQSFEFRYFFPSYCILYIIIVFSVINGVAQFVKQKTKNANF